MKRGRKYSALIVDDESKIREVLQLKIVRFCSGIEVVGQAADVDEAYEKINRIQPEIVFLDISMPGASGFDLLDRFDHITFEIVFVTGYQEYALDALKVSAVDYILKPIKTEDLKDAVSKAVDRIKRRIIIERYEVLKHNINYMGNQETKISIPGAQAHQFVGVKDIIRCEGWQKYTRLFLSTGEIIVSSSNIGVFKEMLTKYSFFSTHKSHLINTKCIIKYLKNGTVVMSDDSIVPVARRRKEDFLEKVVKQLE